MAYSLTWLSQVLQDAGLKVKECDGWQNRGRAEMGQVFGVLCHYTGDPRKGNMPALDILINGRPDLPGPLSQLGLGRDGTYYIIAAGKSNHAGKGSWKTLPLNSGNSHLIGIEAENTGSNDPWPEVQMDAYRRGVAAILLHIKQTDIMWCVGHKEYAPGRKIDPDFNMDTFRAAVKAIMDGADPTSVATTPGEPAEQSRPTLRPGQNNDPALVKIIQAKVGVTADGIFGPATEAAVRAFQEKNGLVADGIVGRGTWGLV